MGSTTRVSPGSNLQATAQPRRAKRERPIVAVDALAVCPAASGVHWKPDGIVFVRHLVRARRSVVILPDGPRGDRERLPAATARRTSPCGPYRKPGHFSPPCLSPLPRTSVIWSSPLRVRAVANSIPAPESLPASEDHGASWRGGQSRSPLASRRLPSYPGQSGRHRRLGRGELLGVNSSVLGAKSVIASAFWSRRSGRSRSCWSVAMSHSLTLASPCGKFALTKEWRAGPWFRSRSMVYSSCMSRPTDRLSRAGINLGDLVVSIDAQPVHGFRQFHHMLVQKRTGEAVKLRVLRAGNATERW